MADHRICDCAGGYIAPPGSIEKVWFDDNNRFEIYFDSQNRVVGFHERFSFQRPPPPPLWDRFLNYLGLRGPGIWLDL